MAKKPTPKNTPEEGVRVENQVASATDREAAPSSLPGSDNPQTGSVGPDESGIAAALANPATGTETSKALNVDPAERSYDPKAEGEAAVSVFAAGDVTTGADERDAAINAEAERRARVAEVNAGKETSAQAIERQTRGPVAQPDPELPSSPAGAAGLGETVLYRHHGAAAGANVFPAIVTRVHEETADGRPVVSLTAFPPEGPPIPIRHAYGSRGAAATEPDEKGRTPEPEAGVFWKA